MTAYIQNKTCQLDAVLEVLFQDTAAWPQAPPPTYLRDTCLEVVYTLVGLCCRKQVCVPKLQGSAMLPSRKLKQHQPTILPDFIYTLCMMSCGSLMHLNGALVGAWLLQCWLTDKGSLSSLQDLAQLTQRKI